VDELIVVLDHVEAIIRRGRIVEARTISGKCYEFNFHSSNDAADAVRKALTLISGKAAVLRAI